MVAVKDEEVKESGARGEERARVERKGIKRKGYVSEKKRN